MNSSNSKSLVKFKAITDFTKQLGDLFASNQRSLKLYCRLIDKTKVSHTASIEKHVKTFKSFCKQNSEAIEKKDKGLLRKNRIAYSSRVFINMNDIFAIADTDTMDVIWNHLIYLSALLIPSHKSKQLLQNITTHSNKSGGGAGLLRSLSTSGDDSNESKFLENIANTIENTADPNASNPMEAVSAVMQSGIFTEIMSGMMSGNLDMNKLAGSLTGMIGSLGENMNQDGQAPPEMMNMINSMTAMMSGMGRMQGTRMPGGNVTSTTTTTSSSTTTSTGGVENNTVNENIQIDTPHSITPAVVEEEEDVVVMPSS